MINIEFFPRVDDRSKHNVQGLDRLLNWATTNEKLNVKTGLYKEWLYENPHAIPKEKSAMKVYYFPAVTFGGTFTGTGRAEDINKMSGLIVLDFDHIQNLAEVRQKLENDNHTFLLFVSPSGDGLKVVVKHDLTNPIKWQYLYFEFEAYYLRILKDVNDLRGKQLGTDPSGKDISRMCFLPYIEVLYRNDNSVVWQYIGEYEMQTKAILSKDIAEHTTTEISDNLYKECLFISAYLFENKINIAENYQDWLSYGYSLCVLGELGREIFHNISYISDKYDLDKCDEQYDYMLSHFDEDRTSITNFINNGKRAIAHQTIYKQFGFLCS